MIKVLFLVVSIVFSLKAGASSCESTELKKEEYLKSEYSSSPNIQVIQNNNSCNTGCSSCNKEKIVYRDRIVYKESKPKVIYRDRVVYRDKIVYKESPVKVVQEEKVVYKPVYKTKYKTRTRTKYVNQPYHIQPKNKKRIHSVSLLGLAAPKTDVQYSSFNNNGSGGSNVDAQETYEADLGMMYQIDLNRLRLSVGGTLGGIGILGVGIVF